MVALFPHNRLGYDVPPQAKILLPTTSLGRGMLWSDVVFEAVLTLKKQLNSRNEAVAAAAANSILELERTRMRHDKTVAGSCLDSDQADDRELDDADCQETMAELPELEALNFSPPPTDAFATHTAEVLKVIPTVGGKPMTRSAAERIVRGFLNEQVIEAEDIASGQFMTHFRGSLRKTAASALPD